MEPIVGTPAIVGFGNGFNGNDIGLGLLGLLLAQRQGADMCAITRDINLTASANHVAIVEAGAASVLATTAAAAATQMAIANACQKNAELAAQAALTACNNQAATLAAIAECCCETKALIIEKANGTDALIRDLDNQRYRQELQDAKNELLAIKFSKPPVA